MKRKMLKALLVVFVVSLALLAFVSCNIVRMQLTFVVEGETYQIIDVTDSEIIAMPQNPTKEGYYFDGWFWDNGTWQRPFTANSLLNQPLTSNIPVYAKFTEIHTQLTFHAAVKPSCTKQGNEAYYTCSCGKIFSDDQGRVELSEIPTLPAGHTYSTNWRSDERGHWHVATCEHTSETTPIESHVYDSSYRCEICHHQTSLRGTAIATEVFTVSGENLYAKVPNSQTTFSFISAIQIADDAEYTLSYDINGTNQIPTKTVSLLIGDNTYYILVTNGKSIQLYTVTLRRRPIYTVTFDSCGGTACNAQQVEEDSLATEPVSSRKGYTFAGWNYDFKQAITANRTITASWTANKYTLTYNVNGGKLAATEYIAMYDAAYTLAVPTRKDYVFQGWCIDDTQITNANGQSLANWTYAEDKTVTAMWSQSYMLTIINPNSNAGTVTGAGYKVYNSEVTVTATEPNLGYEWLGWFIDDKLISTELTCTFIMPETDLTLAPYKVKDEMSNFNFTSTTTTCTVSSVKDKTVTEIIIPEYITSIGKDAFEGCISLTKVNYLGTIAGWCNISFDTDYWSDDYANPLYYAHSLYLNNELVTELEIPDAVTEIKNNAFTGWNGASVTIPDSVTSIGWDAFCNCSNLTSVTIPSSVTSIGNAAFNGCSALTSMTIPDSVTSIGYNVFSGCNRLHYNAYGDALYLGNEENPYVALIYAEYQITSCQINENAKVIAASAFFGRRNLTSITIPDSVTSIGEAAFYNCSGLISITIPSSVTSIGYSTFRGCSSLTDITIPSSVTSIGESAFEGCSALTSMTIPDSVTLIDICVFRNCSSLTSVTIGSSVVSISFDAFNGCSKLQYNEYGNALYLGNDENLYIALIKAKDASITTCQINENTKVIVNRAFESCSSLISVTIGNSVTSIGYCAFQSCYNLKTVYYTGTADDWTKINVNSIGNSYLTNATRYYYSETEPALNAEGTAYAGNYWHYNDNHEIVEWKKGN